MHCKERKAPNPAFLPLKIRNKFTVSAVSKITLYTNVKGLPLEEKKRFIINNKMCFGCLRIGHISKNCRKRATCNICRQNHPSPLHEEHSQGGKPEALPDERTYTSLCSVGMDNCICTSMIVPVWLSCATKDSPETLVYALLDTQSSNTFIDQDVCDKIQANTEPVKLKLSTMTNRASIENCHRAAGLKVRGYSLQDYIELPPAYTLEYIPLHSKLQEGSEMGCSLAQCCKGDARFVGLSRFLKELPAITPASVIRSLEADFRDTDSKDMAISQDDIQFLQQLDEKTHHNKEVHVEMPLPFRDCSQLPNNKQLAIVRLKHLKRKFEKNPQYREDYIRFMDSVFRDGDAEEAEATSKEGNTWYIPHHGVCHPRKPEKIRVVFDYSAKFEGTSLNNHLLTGPDLMNALTGVLCRFREHQIAIVCDVEKMFHRFHVSAEDCDFLRFLWWENGNTEKEPKEYRMRVHIFGAASCANYNMRYLAHKYEKDYPLAASFNHKNFYVDDGLVSVNSVEKVMLHALAPC
ncbi:Retrotransposon-derived protein PEG10 [Labeo rohita]|uniref:Retrotransposon-derived protein PEG10 n=1 Tax=Labeo rohita TaxID=84645 RepID=A0ABQ8L7W6_LABRO|nr:Retrotransposon-derived protein PEG10 [Labeo rohita]